MTLPAAVPASTDDHLALSGLSHGEIGGLRWTNIDLEAKTLTIAPTRISVGGKAVEQDDAKSED